MKKIIIDTNLWISFLITKDYSKLDELLYERKATLVFSQELLDEFLEVAKRPKFRRYFSDENIETLLETIEEYAIFIKVKSVVNICRDSKDNFLLALSKDGKADILLSGDNDLLVLGKFEKTKILTISEFLNKY